MDLNGEEDEDRAATDGAHSAISRTENIMAAQHNGIVKNGIIWSLNKDFLALPFFRLAFRTRQVVL